MAEERKGNVTRRAFARLTLWGAVGLSLVSGCRKTAQKPADPWARLGWVWRELGRHVRENGPDKDDFHALQDDMEAALGQVGASPELERLFEMRWSQVQGDQYRDPGLTCYAPPPPTPGWQARGDLRKQFSELERLREAGSLSEESGRKAAEVIARSLETILREDELPEHADTRRRRRTDLEDAIEAGGPTPRQAAARAAENVVEFSADQPGLLTDKDSDPSKPWDGVRCYSLAPPLKDSE